MNKYRAYIQWVNKTKHWETISTKMSLDELWKVYKVTCEEMGVRLIRMKKDRRL